jgi:hypothetical protein
MQNIDDAIKAGVACLVYPNALGTTTVALVNDSEWPAVQVAIEPVPEDRIIDVKTAIDVDAAVAQIHRKMTRTDEYVDWDEKMRNLGLES